MVPLLQNGGYTEMKRILTIILTITLLTMAVAFADSLIDLSKYSDAQLKEILLLVNQEMVNRKIVKQAKIPAGQYIVGTDIPAGKYEITEQKASSIFGPLIEVYSNGKSDFSNMIVYNLMDPGDTMIVELKNGYLFETNSAIILKTFTGISFE